MLTWLQLSQVTKTNLSNININQTGLNFNAFNSSGWRQNFISMFQRAGHDRQSNIFKTFNKFFFFCLFTHSFLNDRIFHSVILFILMFSLSVFRLKYKISSSKLFCDSSWSWTGESWAPYSCACMCVHVSVKLQLLQPFRPHKVFLGEKKKSFWYTHLRCWLSVVCVFLSIHYS